MPTFTIIFLCALVMSMGVRLWLARRHQTHVQNHRQQVPAVFRDKITLDNHQRAADYTVAKTRLEMVDIFIGAGLLLIWTLGGGLAWLDAHWHGLQLAPLATGVGVLLSVFVLGHILELPMSAYHTFVLEQRFGFNRTTPTLFLGDTFKQGALLIVLGVPLAGLVLWLLESSGEWWWLYTWAVWMGFMLLMMWAYPALIAPLFNRFTPLQDGELRQRVLVLLQKNGFTAGQDIFVMDGSRRSGHGNAYFTGLGANKRIVFYDTLINSLTPDEIEAVLAHELGHFKRHHIHKRIAATAIMTLIGLALLGWLMIQPWFYTGLGVTQPSSYMALVLFLLVLPVFTFFMQPIQSGVMRKHEFEADDFAATQTNPADLVQALVKLYKENAATLTPDPLYSAYHDSHPPAPVRIANLSAKLSRTSEPR